MTERVARNRRRLLLVAAGWIAVAVMGTPSQAQTLAAASPAFEVATIKPGRNTGSVGQMPTADGFLARDYTVYDLIKYAYNLPWGIDGLISGGPSWAHSATFDINAKTEKPMPIVHGVPTGLDLMLQALLADRFKLRAHYETKEIPAYALTVAKGGTKLKPWVAPTTPAADSASTYAFGAYLPTPQKGGMRLERGNIWAPHVTTDWLAGYLQSEIRQTVIDKTADLRANTRSR